MTNEAPQYCITFFNHKKDNAPKSKPLSWPDLCELLTVHDIRIEKDGPLFSANAYRPGTKRGNANVEAITLAVVDFDESATLETILDLCAGLDAIIYSTHSHGMVQKPESAAPGARYRVVIRLREPVPAAEWADFWPRLNQYFDGRLDQSAKDIARIHYLPTAHPDRSEYAVARVVEGEPLRAEALPVVEVPPPLPIMPQMHREHLNGAAASPDQSRRFIEGCFRKELEKIDATADGEKHRQVLKSATYLAGYIGTGQTTAEEIESTLFAAIEQRAKDKQGARITIRDGIKYGEAKPLEIPPLPPKRMLRGGSVRSYIATGEMPAAETDQAEDEESDEAPNEQKTGNYRVIHGRTHNVIEKTDKGGTTTTTQPSIWDGAAHIVEEISAEDGATIFKIEGRTRRKRKFAVEIEAAKKGDPKYVASVLSNVAGAGCVFAAGMEKHIFPSIDSFTDFNNLDYGRRFDRVGWYTGADGEEFVIPGRENETTTINLSRKLPYSIDKTADLAIGLKMFDALIRAQAPAMTTVAITTMFQAPVAKQAGWRDERYALFIAGRTGSFKSSWSMVMMSLWGKDFNFEERLVKFGQGATNNAIMDHFVHASDVPFLVDNYKPGTGGGSRDLVNLIHAALEGGEKDRLNRNSAQRGSRAIHTWPIFTGEDVPDNDAASMARVLVVPFAWSGGENPALTEVQAGSDHLCAVMGAWLDWILSDDGKIIVANIASKFTARRTMWASTLRKMRDNMANINRVATNIATNQLAWEMMMACPTLAPILAPYAEAHAEGLAAVARGMATHTAEAMEANRYIEAIRSLVASKRGLLMPRTQDIPDDAKGKYLGWEDDNGVYLVPEIAYIEVVSLMKENGGFNGVSKNTIHKQLAQINALVEVGADGPVKVKKCGSGNRSHRILWIKPDLIFSEEED